MAETPTHRSATVEPQRGERHRVAFVRWCLQHWPLSRGRGLLLRLAQPLLKERPLVYQLEPGILVQGGLDEHQFLYYFAYGLSHDPSFQLARRIVRRRDAIIDVGANVGFWLLGMARRAGAEASVHAFEPFPANFERLQQHVALNQLSGVRCHQLAVGATPGQAGFIGPSAANSGLGSLAPPSTEGKLSVSVTTLDTFCQEHGLSRVDVLKVDVEGAELMVFQGAKRLLASDQAPILMFEMGDALASRFGTTSPHVKNLLAGTGYGVFRFDGLRLRRVSASASHPRSEDLFALRPSHLAERPFLKELID